MRETLPKITILLATYNRSHLIEETLNSIIAQSYLNWECVIIDDNSTDSTIEVVKKYIEIDNRFSYFLKTKNYKKGLSGTRNFGLDIAEERKAQFIQFFDDDDIMHPQKIELQVEPFLKNSKLNFTICKFEKILQNSSKKIVKPKFNFNCKHLGDVILTGEFVINSLSCIWNMKVLNQFRFDEDLDYAEDWELFTRIGYKYPSPNSFVLINEYLFQYRKHKKTLTLGDDKSFNRRKSSAIIRIKILEYLTNNKLHTKTSIKFLAKTFLLKYYNPLYVKELLNYSSKNISKNFKLNLFLNLGILIIKLIHKVVSKIISWS